MPFTVTIPKIDEAPKGPGSLVADRRLYIAADEKTLAEDGDEKAAWLLAPKGGIIHGADVARLDLSMADGRIVQGAVAAEPPTDAKPSSGASAIGDSSAPATDSTGTDGAPSGEANGDDKAPDAPKAGKKK